MSRHTHLKIKLHTLADEGRHIRREARKELAQARTDKQRLADGHAGEPEEHYGAYLDLYLHRTQVVRPAAREAHLAACFLRGTPYAKCEEKTRTPLNLRAVKKLVERFGTTDDLARWGDWQTEATGHLDAQDVHVSLPPNPVKKEVA